MADSAVVISLFYELNVSAKIITSRISIQFSNISIFGRGGGRLWTSDRRGVGQNCDRCGQGGGGPKIKHF